jgi:hypothetical protein
LRAYVGDFDKAAHRFHPEKLVRMNWPGGMLFAGESLESPDGRRIFWVMIHDPRTGPSQHATGRNSMTLPRVLDICAKWGTPKLEYSEAIFAGLIFGNSRPRCR